MAAPDFPNTLPADLAPAPALPQGTVTRAMVVAEARSWLNTPWQHQARMKGVGVDCAGLVIGVARALGLVPPEMDVGDYARRPDGTSLLRHCQQWMLLIEPRNAREGDVIVIRFDVDPQHLAILGDAPGGGLTMIHALDRPGHVGGKVIEHRFAPFYLPVTVAAFRLPGVVD